ncbi:MAG: SRPBCC family protein [Flavihumibacter sp.]
MRKLFKILGWLLLILLLAVCAGFLFPAKVSISRATEIKAAPEQVFDVLTDLTTYNEWMAWNQVDPAMKIEWGASKKGKGAGYKWFSTNRSVGNGSLEITEADPYKKVSTSMVFGESPDPALATWTLEPGNGLTRVNWRMTMDMGMNPLARWAGKLMRGMMEKDFDKGLNQLREKIESGKLGVLSPALSIEKTQVGPLQLLTVMDTAQGMGDIGPLLQKAYGEIGELMKAQHLEFAAAPIAWYLTAGDPYVVEAAVPVTTKPAATAGRIKMRSLPAGEAVVVRYYGPYEKTDTAYALIAEWLKNNGRKAKGKPFDQYIDDPTTKASIYEVRTDIIQLLD